MAVVMKKMMQVPSDDVGLLRRLESLVSDRMEKESYFVASPFSERHGAWELRLMHSAGPDATHLIFLSCEIDVQRAIPIQVWAGVSVGTDETGVIRQSERLVVGKATVSQFRALDSRLETMLMEAIETATDLEASLRRRGTVVEVPQTVTAFA